ncbi:hypothetical protein [Candidatus Protochlamydia naegleriophila]|nr:hypothetical protein [Candidatus Protochlamydia naegleriophila]
MSIKSEKFFMKLGEGILESWLVDFYSGKWEKAGEAWKNELGIGG